MTKQRQHAREWATRATAYGRATGNVLLAVTAELRAQLPLASPAVKRPNVLCGSKLRSRPASRSRPGSRNRRANGSLSLKPVGDRLPRVADRPNGKVRLAEMWAEKRPFPTHRFGSNTGSTGQSVGRRPRLCENSRAIESTVHFRARRLDFTRLSCLELRATEPTRRVIWVFTQPRPTAAVARLSIPMVMEAPYCGAALSGQSLIRLHESDRNSAIPEIRNPLFKQSSSSGQPLSASPHGSGLWPGRYAHSKSRRSILGSAARSPCSG